MLGFVLMSNPELSHDTTEDSMLILQAQRVQGVNDLLRQEREMHRAAIHSAFVILSGNGVYDVRIMRAKLILQAALDGRYSATPTGHKSEKDLRIEQLEAENAKLTASLAQYVAADEWRNEAGQSAKERFDLP